MTDPFRQALDDAALVELPSVLGDDCPVAALGHRDGTFYVIDAAGQVRGRRQRDLGPLGVLELFMGDATWLLEHCPIEGRNQRRDGKFPWDNPTAAGLIMRACRAAGFFDPVSDVRGPGIWADDAAPPGQDGLVCHFGDRVLRLRWDTEDPDRIHQQWEPGGAIIDGLVYPAGAGEWAGAAAALDMPADVAAAEHLVAHFGRWRWSRPKLDPVLATGFAVGSYLAGAMPYRTTLWLLGDIGVGKSGILDSIGLLHGTADWIWDDVTASAIKREVGRQARCVMCDELELKDDNRRAREIVELARFVYKRGRGHYARAGADAGAGRLDAMFAWGSVEPPPIEPADASRHCDLHLAPLPVDAAAGQAYADSFARLRDLAPCLRARILLRWHDFEPCHAAIRAALAKRALAGRVADTFAPLLAAWWLFTHDAPPGEQLADFLVDDLYDDLTDGLVERQRAHQLCWDWILTRPVEYFRSDQRRTVGSLLADGVYGSPGDVNDALGRYGIQIIQRDLKDGQGMRRFVFVAIDSHAGLREIFRGSKWEDGGWTVLLRRLPYAVAAPDSVRFGGGRPRGTLIPAEYYVEKGADAAPPVQGGGEIPPL